MFSTDLKLLNDYIKESGYRREYIAKFLGLSRASFIYRMRGKIDFSVSEANKLCILLDLNTTDIMNIFFAKKLNVTHLS